MNKQINRRAHQNWIIQAGNQVVIISEVTFRGSAKRAEDEAQKALQQDGVNYVALYFESTNNRPYRTKE